ncbi:hypothetical protein AB0K43_23225 [Kitasatospora sp. NPDC049258]|uniref:hypothetical protein n=1 Tax=Kitasatospora sp. NPDC049258 TaxID=3155394 RepID=UPI00343E2882
MPAPALDATPPPAGYLRYYPYSCSELKRHCEALRGFAARLGLPAPALYLDNGYPSTAPRPGLRRLARVLTGIGGLRVLCLPRHDLTPLRDARRSSDRYPDD